MNQTTFQQAPQGVVADALPAERAAFIRKTYIHLAIAVGLFAIMEGYLVTTGTGFAIAKSMLSVSWAIVLIAFMGIAWLANTWARSTTSKPIQYMGLILYTVAQVIIFLPLMFLSMAYSGPDVVLKAGVVTAGTGTNDD